MMGVQNLVFHKTHFIFLFKKMFLFLRDLWRCFFPLFGFTGKYIFSFIRQKKNSNSKMIQHQEDQQNNEGKTELDNDKDVGEVKEEESEAVLRFHFPTYEEFLQNSNKKGQSLSYSSLCGNSDDKFVHVDAKDTIAKPKSSLDFSLIAKLEFSMGNDVFGSENHGIFLDESLHVGNIIENDDAKKNLKVENGEGLSEQMNDSTNDEDVLNNGSLFLDDDESLVNATTSNEDVMKDSTHLRSHGESLVNGSTNDEDVMEDSTHLPSHGESMVNVTKNDEDVMEDSTHLPSHGESLMNVKTNDEDVIEYSTHLPSHGESLVNVTTNDEDVMEDSTHLRSHGESLVNVTKNDEYVMEDSNHLPTHGESLVNFTTNDEDVMEDSTHLLSHGESLVNVTTNNEDFMKYNTHLPSDNESLVSDSDSDTIAPSSESSFRSSFIDSLSDGFLSDVDFERASEVDTPTEFGWDEINLTKEALEKEDLEFQNLSKGYEADDFDDEDEDILDELKNLESNLEGDNGDSNKKHEANTETKAENEQNDEKQSSGEQLSSDSDEQNGLETQWEHQDLVEQLKMEIKKVRAIGLPTILEEFETPKIMDDLKPWKIEEKYKLGGTLDELYKFYKSYKERMRKLDILNYQKMYAIGFLRLKDPLKSFSKNRISTTALSAIVSLDCWPFKPKLSTEINQPDVEKFSKELESDLEMVYVGQMCLSWELLRWQYGKALELWETDPHGVHLYNEVAGKFQTFQVLLTRFIEDERFQGPRVQNYVKKRCVQRNLLQVPLIRGDNTRDRRKEKKVVSSKESITSLQLVEIIEESIRILWRFIKADKETSYIGLLKCRKSSNVELQNPADANLLEEIQSSLQKKEKKLRELLRSRNCILKKIQKHHQEEESYHALYFFSQVDLRLVSRVLNMPRITTEQLVWCSDKLNNICLVDRKLHVDPSIVLLFPCS